MEISSKSGCFILFLIHFCQIFTGIYFFFNFDSAGIQWFNNGVSNIFNREEKMKRFHRKSSSDDNTACNWMFYQWSANYIDFSQKCTISEGKNQVSEGFDIKHCHKCHYIYHIQQLLNRFYIISTIDWYRIKNVCLLLLSRAKSTPTQLMKVR